MGNQQRILKKDHSKDEKEDGVLETDRIKIAIVGK